MKASIIVIALCVAACSSQAVLPPDPQADVPGTVRAVSMPDVSSETDTVAGLQSIERGVVACFAAPRDCEPAHLAAPGSPALAYLESLQQHYLAHDLVARQVVAGVRYVVPERVERVGPDRAAITLCEVDGSWQIDRRGTDDPADDAVFDDTLVSRRARHELVHQRGRWVRWEITELELWIGVNACPAPS